MYQLSDKLITIQNGEDYFIYHSLYNNPRIVDKDIIDFLNIFINPISASEVFNFDNETKEVFDEFCNLGFIEKLNDNSFNQKILQKQNEFINTIQNKKTLNRLELAISDACNLGCSHCMHFKNNSIEKRTSPNLNMTIENAKSSIDKFVKLVKNVGNNTIRVHFGNGEPLINWNTLKFCLEYCHSIKDINFTYAVNTNLTLLTREMALTLKKYNCKISTSLDGMENGNDLVRQDLSGKGTFNKIIEKISLLQEIDFPLTGFGITILKNNFNHINNDIIDFAKEINIKEITVDFDLVDIMDIPTEEAIEKVLSLRAYALKNNIRLHGNWAQPYKNIFTNSWLNKPYSYCPAIEGDTIEFGVNGDLKTCGHTSTIIGHKDNINNIFSNNSNYLELIKQRLPGNNMDICKECEIEGACGGQCHVTWEASQQNKEIMLIKCEFTKKITKELIKEHLKGIN